MTGACDAKRRHSRRYRRWRWHEALIPLGRPPHRADPACHAPQHGVQCGRHGSGEVRGERRGEGREAKKEAGRRRRAYVTSSWIDCCEQSLSSGIQHSSRLGVWIERCCICTTDVEAESHRYTNDSTTEGEKEDNVSTTTATVAERGSRGWPLQYQEGDTRASAYTPDACRGREVQTKETLVERGGEEE